MAKKIFSEIQIILIFASAVFAYDFAALREAMFQNNPELLTLQEEYRRSELDVKDAWAGLGPTIDMQVSGTYMLNPPVDAVYLNVDDIVNSVQWPSGVKPVSSGQYVKIYDGMENTLYSVQFTLTQPLFTWGKLENAISLYNQISKIKLTQLESKQQQLETELETRLISLKYLERINEIIEEEKLYADRLVKVSENAEKSGMFLHQDVVEARIQAKELEIAQQDLLEQINNQILELKRSTGIEDLNYEQLEYELDEEMVLAVLTGEKQEMEEIVRVHFENIDENLLKQAMDTFYWIREIKEVRKKPSTSELIDWLNALAIGGIDPEVIRKNLPYLGVLIKKDEDMDIVKKRSIY